MIRKIILTFLLLSSPLYARTYKDLKVTLVRVYDGDTIVVKIDEAPDVFCQMSVRIYGIDCPEMRSKSKKERALAQKAKMFTESKLVEKSIVLRNVRRDKYFRLLADIEVKDGDLGTLILNEGLGKPYFGKKKETWNVDESQNNK